ncbi:hypothetical protein F3Y22_tig00111996pilonHSYRG00069 [Hibiscus syriacus]|uniref:DUF1985 domain-containing protein n=1 Tax=Hibiscus syriacus TaxID=106335 RepID=A0A6A2YA21_HIBSY|nr:hypothetical protein F3Y22_tig00111996pilonHSYRG00069 [Hibiscus syriacus]
MKFPLFPVSRSVPDLHNFFTATTVFDFCISAFRHGHSPLSASNLRLKQSLLEYHFLDSNCPPISKIPAAKTDEIPINYPVTICFARKRLCLDEVGEYRLISISHSLRRHPSPSPTKSVPISNDISLHLRQNHSRSKMENQPNQPPSNFYSAQLTLRNKVSLAKTIALKLSPAQRKIFEDTCFGPWLKVQHPGGDAMLTHLFLQTMTSDLPETIQRRDEEIWFDFPPAYMCFGREEFCLITGLHFGHDDVDRYTRHITRLSWFSRVFPQLSTEKSNLHVEDLTRLLNKKDGFTRMDDIDVVRVCLLILLQAGFLGREGRQPIPNDLIKLVEDLNAWNMFPWGSYLWKATWNKLSSAFDDRKSLRGDGSKYTLSGFIFAFKEANTLLQRLTPTEVELDTDWWQASKHFFNGTDDEQPSLREPSPHPEPSPDRPEYTPPQRESSPILSHHRASSPPSPHDRRPAKMPRRLSPCSPPLPPPPRDELGELRNEVNSLREEVGTLRDDNGAWRVEVSTLCGECKESVRKKPYSPVIVQEASPIVQEAPIIPQESPPTVQEATIIVEEIPPNILEPDSHDVIYRIIEKPPHVPDMMNDCWLLYKLSASTIPVDEVERKQLPETILDNTLWAKTAVDFYLHERSQGCYADIYKLNDDMHLLIERSWWGVLLGVEDNDYFDGGNKKPKKFNVTVIRDETAPQQTKEARGDCGPLVCMCLERLTTGSTQFLPPTDRDRGAVGLWFRHFMARTIYARRCLLAFAL